MSDDKQKNSSVSISTRRSFLKKSVFAVGGLGSLGTQAGYTFASTVVTALNAPGSMAAVQAPVLSLFMDQPYFDMSGSSNAYLSPQSTNSDEKQVTSETEWRMHHPHL